jgi:hypothetical protein
MQTTVEMSNGNEKKRNLKALFFWTSYIALLGISTPHMAYFFSSFTDKSVFEWVLSYGAAFAIEGSVYIATYTLHKNMGYQWSWDRFWANCGLFIWIISCMSVSWLANSAHAAHFKNDAMLTGTDGVPLAGYFIYVVGAWPLFGIIFSMVSNVVTKEYVTHAPTDTRSVEQIEDDAMKQVARLRAQFVIDSAKSEIRGGQIGNAIKHTLGGAISGLRETANVSSIVPNTEQTQNDTHISEVLGEDTDTGLLETDSSISLADYSITASRNGHSETANATLNLTMAVLNDEERAEELWDEVKIVDAAEVKYSSVKPFFTTQNGLTFVSIRKAYQPSESRNAQIYGMSMADPSITEQSLRAAIEKRLIEARYLRYVRNKNRVVTTILVRDEIREHILNAVSQV